MADHPPASPGPKCPLCGKPSDQHYRPFCSRRCADVDLARWLGGKYAIPVQDHDDDEDGNEAAAGSREDGEDVVH